MSDRAQAHPGHPSGELSGLLTQIGAPAAVADETGVIQAASAAWEAEVTEAGVELGPGARLREGPLADACARLLAGERPCDEAVVVGRRGQMRVRLSACQLGGRPAVLLQRGDGQAELQEITGALRERERQFEAIAANLPGILYRVVLAPDGTIEFPYVSGDTVTIAGRRLGEHWLDRIHPDDRTEFFEVLRSSAEQLLPFDLEQRVIGVPGQEVWVRNITRPHRRPDGAVVWDGMVLDITSQKRVELDLQRSLREKDSLLQEVHHRVKNNLQIISSLLDLQALSIADPSAQRSFVESQRRIRAMALVHEQLYHVETMSQIEFRSYVQTLMEYLQQSFEADSLRVRVGIAIDSIWLDANAAIPCGLIINELVSNAFKHAFPRQQAGEIEVSCAPAPEGQLVLTVADTGVGMPVPAEQRPGALGLRLVRTLVRQLHGQLLLAGPPGTQVSIRFTPGPARGTP